MNKEEALLQLYQFKIDFVLTAEQKEVIEVAKKALKKQIPEKPIIEGDGYYDGKLIYDTWMCANCNKRFEIDYDEYDYCPNCGQHIDWE